MVTLPPQFRATFKGRPRGITLLEMGIAISVLSVAILAALVAVRMASRSAASGIQYSSASRNAQRVFDGIAEDFNDATLDSLLISPAGDSVTFQRVTGFNAGAKQVILSQPITFRWELDGGEIGGADGVDDNNNGIVDEGRVVRVENGDLRVIARDIGKSGLTFVHNGFELVVTVQPYYMEYQDDVSLSPVATEFATSFPILN